MPAEHSITALEAEKNTLLALRNDALDRGMRELAITYGWATVRLGFAIIHQMARGTKQ